MCSQPSSIPSLLLPLEGFFTFSPDYLLNAHDYGFTYRNINSLFPHHGNTDSLHILNVELVGFQVDLSLSIIDVLGDLT